MSKLSEFHRKNSFEYISFLIQNLLKRIEEIESVSNTLYEMFMIEHNNIGKMFKGE